MRRSGIPREKTLCIGDETRDIEAARAAGADSAGVAWGYATPEALVRCGPTLMFSTFADVVAAIVVAA
jgi:phosphoglycolate phosphatase